MRDLADELPKRRIGDFDKDGRTPNTDMEFAVFLAVSIQIVFWNLRSCTVRAC
jgi:hypothetical protein